jgi:hypothetical protein
MAARPIPAFARRGVLIDPESPASGPGTWKHKLDVGFIEVDYVGDSEDPISVYAPSGRHYIFDTDKHCKALVHPLDLNYLRMLEMIA